jgi:DNA processing protein
LSAAGVPVVSGLALGVDSAAHAGALEAPGRTIGVLAASAHVPYPARGHRLHAAVAARGAVISEMPPGANAFRWCFVARNRIIAALSAATVVVQATERSGSLTTADFAAEVGRTVGAVPGPVTSRLSSGTHQLIQSGAPLIRDAADALDMLAGATGRVFAGPAASSRPQLSLPLTHLLDAIEDGAGTLGELAETADQARAALTGLAELERLGLVRRGFAGRWERAA